MPTRQSEGQEIFDSEQRFQSQGNSNIESALISTVRDKEEKNVIEFDMNMGTQENLRISNKDDQQYKAQLAQMQAEKDQIAQERDGMYKQIIELENKNTL